MTKRTRLFLIVSGGILVAGLGTGLVAAYVGGLQNLTLIGSSGPDELAYIPSDARVVAYANVREIMDSELHQKLRSLHQSPQRRRPGAVRGRDRRGRDHATWTTSSPPSAAAATPAAPGPAPGDGAGPVRRGPGRGPGAVQGRRGRGLQGSAAVHVHRVGRPGHDERGADVPRTRPGGHGHRCGGARRPSTCGRARQRPAHGERRAAAAGEGSQGRRQRLGRGQVRRADRGRAACRTTCCSACRPSTGSPSPATSTAAFAPRCAPKPATRPRPRTCATCCRASWRWPRCRAGQRADLAAVVELDRAGRRGQERVAGALGPDRSDRSARGPGDAARDGRTVERGSGRRPKRSRFRLPDPSDRGRSGSRAAGPRSVSR